MRVEIPYQLNSESYDAFMYKFIEVTATHVLFRGEPITDKNKKVLPLDAKSFKCIAPGYFLDKNNTYGMTIISKSHSEKFYLTPIPVLDRNSFEPINLYYAKDKNNTYFADNGKVIKGTDFKILTRFIDDEKTQEVLLSEKSQYRSDIILNDRSVYYRGKLLKDADANSFCQVGRHWFKDNKRVYFVDAYEITAYNGFNAKTFIALGYSATDKYTNTATLFHNSAPESLIDFGVYKNFFEKHPELSDYWYFNAKKKRENQTNLDPIPLAHGFYQLGNEIFYKDRIKDVSLTRILDTDIANFKFLSEEYATNGKSIFLIRDEYWSYYKRFREITVAIETIEILSEAFVYDGTYFYYKAFKKFKADRSSFVVLNHIHAYDKDGLIVEGVRKKDVVITKNIKSIGGTYIKIEAIFYYMGKSRNKTKIDDSQIKLINDFIIMGADGSAFNHGKYRKYIGDFDKFHQLENGHWGDGTLEWKIAEWGLELVP